MFAVAGVLLAAVRRGRPSGQHGRGRRASGRVPSPGQHALEFGGQTHGGRQRLDVVMGETPAFLAVVAAAATEFDAVNGRQVAGAGRCVGQTAAGCRVVRCPGELAVSAPEPVEL